jgi:hypothetical protein
MTYVEIKYGLLAVVLSGLGLLGLVMLISGAHLLVREVARSAKRWRTRRFKVSFYQKRAKQEQLYAGAGD